MAQPHHFHHFRHGFIEFHRQEHHLEDSCVCLPHPVLNLPPIRSAAGGDVHSLALDETGAGDGEMGIRKGAIETHRTSAVVLDMDLSYSFHLGVLNIISSLVQVFISNISIYMAMSHDLFHH